MTFNDSSLPPVLPGDAAALAATVAGSVLLPGDAGYDDERAVFNLNHDLVPAVIVVPQSAADIQAAITSRRGSVGRFLVKTTGHQIVPVSGQPMCCESGPTGTRAPRRPWSRRSP
jgi:hypothetical protein